MAESETIPGPRPATALRGLVRGLSWRSGLVWKAIVLGAAVLLLVWVGRGQTFVQDEWDVIQYRLPSSSLSSLLIAHNQHFLGFDFVLYKAVFAVAGLHRYGPYQLVDLVAHLVVVMLLFEVARRRIGASLAFFVILPILVVGSAEEDVLIPFDEQWVITVAVLLGVILLLDRGDRRADLWVCVLLLVGVTTSSFGPVVAAGVLLRLLWDRDRWRRVWVALIPLGAYVLWYVRYGLNAATAPGYHLTASPGYLLDTAAGVVGGLLGVPLGAPDLAQRWWLVDPFRLLTVVLAGLLIHGLITHKRRLTPDLSMLLAILILYFGLITLSRGYQHLPFASRYLYVGEVATLLVVVEVFRGQAIPSLGRGIVIAAACVVTVVNAGILIHYANQRRYNSAITRAEVGALQVARNPHLSSTFHIDTDQARAPTVEAGVYFAAIDHLHSSPAPSPGGIAAEPEYARAAADSVLVRAGDIGPVPLNSATLKLVNGAPRPLSPGVRVEQLSNASATSAASCVRFRPSGGGEAATAVSAAPGNTAALIEAPTDVVVAVRVRRFADRFPSAPLFTRAGSAIVPIAAGHAPQPWHLQLRADAPVEICFR